LRCYALVRRGVGEVVNAVAWGHERVRQRRAVDARSDLKLIQRHQFNAIALAHSSMSAHLRCVFGKGQPTCESDIAVGG
jgi:hypothetical protein